MYFKSLSLKLAVSLMLSVLITFGAFADMMDGEEAAAFANFIQDLVSTTQTIKHGEICSFGSDEISKIIARSNGYIDLDIEPSKYGSCKAIYVSMNQQKGLGHDIEKFNKEKILTIAIFNGFTEIGGMVQVEMGRRNFELTLNSKKIKAAGVRLNALIMSLVINSN